MRWEAFIGELQEEIDTLSSDHAMAANCQLLLSGYELTSCKPTLTTGGAAYGNDTSVRCRTNLHPSISHFETTELLDKLWMNAEQIRELVRLGHVVGFW